MDWDELKLPDIEYTEPPDDMAIMDIKAISMFLGLPYKRPKDYDESIVRKKEVQMLLRKHIEENIAYLWEEWYD